MAQATSDSILGVIRQES